METKKFGTINVSFNHEDDDVLNAIHINDTTLRAIIPDVLKNGEGMIKETIERLIETEQITSFHQALLTYSQDFEKIPFGISLESKITFLFVLGVQTARRDYILMAKMLDICSSNDGKPNSQAIEELADTFQNGDEKFEKVVVSTALCGVFHATAYAVKHDHMFALKMALAKMSSHASGEDSIEG